MMDRMAQWKLLDALNIYQIALLMTGYDPSEFEFIDYHNWGKAEKTETAAILRLLMNAVHSDVLTLKRCVTYDQGDGSINWDESLILVADLRAWLLTKNSPDRFFITSTNDTKAISNVTGEFYAPKLAAAIRAWTEVSSSAALRKGKSVKQAIEDWLLAHASEYGLVNKDGSPNLGGIEQICKVANWQPKGGAPSTPASTEAPVSTPTPELTPTFSRTRGQEVKNLPPRYLNTDMDDEIPF